MAIKGSPCQTFLGINIFGAEVLVQGRGHHGGVSVLGRFLNEVSGEPAVPK